MGAMQRVWNFLGFAEEDVETAPADGEEPRRRRAPVLSLHAHRQMEIVVQEPRTFDEARTAADHLKARRPVIINLGQVDRDLAKRIVDFTCGVVYAVEGTMQRIGDQIFLFAPSTVTVMAESVRDEAREYFPIG